MSDKVKLADGSVPRVVAMVLAMLLGAAAARASVLDQSVPSNDTLGLSPYESPSS